MEMRQQVATSNAKPPEPKVSPEDKEKAAKFLEVSEAQARSFEAPLRSYMLYQIAQGQTELDKAKARTLFKDAFTSTLEIQGDDDLKQRIQDSILTGLLTVSQADVEELLPQAEPPARKKATVAIAKKYLAAKKFSRAVELVEGMTAWTEFPYDIASQIMEVLPEQMNGDFRTLFTQAFSSYQTHPHKGSFFGDGNFAGMVVRFGNRLPPRMTLDAIDEILKQAKAEEDAAITISGEGGAASFNSPYEYQLFQLLPLIKKLDPGHAKVLVDADTTVKALGTQYPDGVQSLSPEQSQSGGGPNPSPGKPRGLSFDVHSGKGGGGSAEDQLAYETERRARQLAKDSETDPLQAIAQVSSLPPKVGEVSPRANALLGIARANIKKNPMAAKQALDEARISLQDIRPQFQVRVLVPIAKSYLDIENPDSAQKALDEGFKLSEKMLTDDTNADDPNKALKAYWPSVESFRQFLEIEDKISRDDAITKLDEIQDPEMQTIERVMFTQVLLGKPMRSSVVSRKTKNSNWMSMSNSD